MTTTTPDCSNLDNYLGKPMQPGRLREPLSNTDVRRWVQAMHFPNRLHYHNECYTTNHPARLRDQGHQVRRPHLFSTRR